MAIKKSVGDNLGLYLLLGALVLVVLFYQPGILLSPDKCDEGMVFNEETGVCEEDGVWVDGSEYLYDENGEPFLDDIIDIFDPLINPDDPDTAEIEYAYEFGTNEEFYVEPSGSVWEDDGSYYDEVCTGEGTDIDPVECTTVTVAPLCEPNVASKEVVKEKVVILGLSTTLAEDKTTLLNEADNLRGDVVKDQADIATGMNCIAKTDDTECVRIGKTFYSLSVEPLKKVPGTCKNPRPNSESSPKIELNNALSANGQDQEKCFNNLGQTGRTWAEPFIQAYNCESSFSCKVYSKFDLRDVSYDSGTCTGKAELKLWCGDRPEIEGIVNKQAKVKVKLVGTFNLECGARFNTRSN